MSVWFGLRLILIFQWTFLLLSAGDQHGFCHQATCVAKTTSLGQTPVVSTPNRSTCVEFGRTEEDCEGLGQSSLEGPYVHHPYKSYNGVNGTLRQRIVEVHAVQEDQQIQLRLLPKVPTSLAGSDRSQFCRSEERSEEVSQTSDLCFQLVLRRTLGASAMGGPTARTSTNQFATIPKSEIHIPEVTEPRAQGKGIWQRADSTPRTRKRETVFAIITHLFNKMRWDTNFLRPRQCPKLPHGCKWHRWPLRRHQLRCLRLHHQRLLPWTRRN